MKVALKNIKLFAGLLLGVLIFVTANSLIGIYIPIQGYRFLTSTQIGLLTGFYFAGYLSGSIIILNFINRVAHARTCLFSLALFSLSTLLFSFQESMLVWALSRLLAGFGIAGIYLVVESWISAITIQEERGSAFAIYRISELTAVIIGNLIYVMGVNLDGILVIKIILGLSILSAIPFSITVIPQPSIKNDSMKLKPKALWRVTKYCTVLMLLIGMNSTTLWSMTPVYLKKINLSEQYIPLVICSLVLGGILAQLPISHLANRFDRRKIISLLSLFAITALGFDYFHDLEYISFILFFFIGAACMPIYSLLMNLAMDRAEAEVVSQISSQSLFVFAIGSIIGPFICGKFIDQFASFGFILFLGLLLFTIFLFSTIQSFTYDPEGQRIKRKYQLFPQGGLLIYLNRRIRRDRIKK